MTDLPTTEVKGPKEVENVLLRIPTTLRDAVADQASKTGVSQNAYITNSLLFGTLIYGQREYMGEPDNLRALSREIDRAIAENDAAMGAFHSKDWDELAYIIDALAQGGLVTNLKVRPDTQATDTTVYTFTLSKSGRGTWPALKKVLEMVACQHEQGKLPMS